MVSDYQGEGAVILTLVQILARKGASSGIKVWIEPESCPNISREVHSGIFDLYQVTA